MVMARFKLVFFCPRVDTARVLEHLFNKYPKDLGKIGNYEQCAFVSHGNGQFKPVDNDANPTIGQIGKLESVEEDRVELVINDKGDNEEVKKAVYELKTIHPYEEVAYDVYKLEDF